MEQRRGDGFFETLHPEDELLFRRGWQAALESGGNFKVEARVRGANSVYRWFLVRSIPQRSPKAEIARGTGSISTLRSSGTRSRAWLWRRKSFRTCRTR